VRRELVFLAKKSIMQKYFLLSVGIGMVVGLAFSLLFAILPQGKQSFNWLPFAVICVLVGILVGVISYRIGKKTLLSVLRNLYYNFNIISTGDFSQRMELSGDDEIGELAVTFNKFVDTIEELFQQVENSKAKITGLYKEIAASEEELRRQYQQLAKYNQEIKQNEEKLYNLAHFDGLTGLPNRTAIMNRLEFLIKRSRENQKFFAVVFIDLDNLKETNDTMGHHMGDLLLQSVGSKLQPLLNEEDILGRLGGDEFALVTRQELTEETFYQYIKGLKDCLRKPVSIDGVALDTNASFGIAVYPRDGENPGQLLRAADAAMYQAKFDRKNAIRCLTCKPDLNY
jgi:diguanylate cyclase (GGDEF)-like protein